MPQPPCDKPNLLFFPGLDGGALGIQPLFKLLAPYFNLQKITYAPAFLPHYAAQYDAIRAQLPSKAPCHLLAESFGGPLAVLHAAKQPASVQSLTLCASFLRSPVPWPLGSCLRALPLKAGDAPPLLPFLLGTASGIVPAKLIQRILLNGEMPDLALEIRHFLSARTQRQGLAGRICALSRLDLHLQTWPSTLKTLYLQAEDDRILGSSPRKETAERIPNLRTVQVPGPHLLLQTQPQACAAAILTHTTVEGPCPTLDLQEAE